MATPVTVDETLFGADGVCDPVMFHPGLVGIKRKVNFSVTNATSGASYALFGLPKAFVVTGAFLEETEKCNAGTIALKVHNKTDSTNDKTVLAATNVGGSVLARGAAQLGTAVVLNDGDIVSMIATPSSGNMVKGEVNLVVYGHTPYGDSLGNVVTPDYRSIVQPHQNTAGLDPWQNVAKRGA